MKTCCNYEHTAVDGEQVFLLLYTLILLPKHSRVREEIAMLCPTHRKEEKVWDVLKKSPVFLPPVLPGAQLSPQTK